MTTYTFQEAFNKAYIGVIRAHDAPAMSWPNVFIYEFKRRMADVAKEFGLEIPK